MLHTAQILNSTKNNEKQIGKSNTNFFDVV